VKTLEQYMNDPGVAHMQMPLREVKAIRLMIHDETKGMTPSERTAYYNGSIKRAQEKGFNFKTVTTVT
jgi:hypothetical protein